MNNTKQTAGINNLNQGVTKETSSFDSDQVTTKSDIRLRDDLINHHDEEHFIKDETKIENLDYKEDKSSSYIDPAVKQWTSTVKSLELFKFLSIGLIVITIALSGLLYMQINKPFLAYDRADKKVKELSSMKLTNEDVKDFIEKFVEQRYTWKEFDPKKITYALKPYATKTFLKGLSDLLGNKKAKNKPGESIEQYVTRIKPILTNTDSFAIFDRILRINDIPIIVPVQIKLGIIKGRKTSFNPMGLYVNSLIEFEN
ncbi:MAG TPA: hypothetical protein PKC21_01960 [Oligoflexia bacterium]|nr:hypothetical protein [bacterium]HMR24096.1 hypothetical protein [Oligoflexia bacterium]